MSDQHVPGDHYGRESLSIHVRGLAPDDWPENGVHGYGLGSRVTAIINGHQRFGVAEGAVQGAEEWYVSVRFEGGGLHSMPARLWTSAPRS